MTYSLMQNVLRAVLILVIRVDQYESVIVKLLDVDLISFGHSEGVLSDLKRFRELLYA